MQPSPPTRPWWRRVFAEVHSSPAGRDVNVLRAAFAGFHPQVQHVLAACPAVHKGRYSITIRCPAGRTAT